MFPYFSNSFSHEFWKFPFNESPWSWNVLGRPTWSHGFRKTRRWKLPGPQWWWNTPRRYIYKYNNLYIYIYVYIDIYIYIFYRHLGKPLRIFEYLIEGFECIWVVKLTSKDFQGLQLSCLKQYTCLPTTQIKFTKTQREMSWDLQSPPTILNLVMFNMYIIYIYIYIYICVCLRVSSVQLIYYIHILYI